MVLLIVFLSVILIPGLNIAAKSKSKRIKCVNNLKNISLGFRIAYTDNGGWNFADSSAMNEREKEFSTHDDIVKLFQSISNEIGPSQIWYCPSDVERTVGTAPGPVFENGSYFLNMGNMPSWLAGDRNLTSNGVDLSRTVLTVATNAPTLQWTAAMHNLRGNIAMGDGSVRQSDNAGLAILSQKLTSIDKLVFP